MPEKERQMRLTTLESSNTESSKKKSSPERENGIYREPHSVEACCPFCGTGVEAEFPETSGHEKKRTQQICDECGNSFRLEYWQLTNPNEPVHNWYVIRFRSRKPWADTPDDSITEKTQEDIAQMVVDTLNFCCFLCGESEVELELDDQEAFKEADTFKESSLNEEKTCSVCSGWMSFTRMDPATQHGRGVVDYTVHLPDLYEDGFEP